MDSDFFNEQRDAHQAALRAGILHLLEINGVKQQELAQRLERDKGFFNRQISNDLVGTEHPISANLIHAILGLNDAGFVVPNNLREDLLGHLEQVQLEQGRMLESLGDERVEAIMHRVGQYRMDSLHLPNPEACATALTQGIAYGMEALNVLERRRSRYEAARSAIVIHDLMRTANRMMDSAYYARLAQGLLEGELEHDDSAAYRINAIYAEATTLRLAGSAERSIRIFEQVKIEGAGTPWEIHAERERLMAELMRPRFSFGTWISDLKAHEKELEKLPSNHEAWLFASQRSRAQALAKTGKRNRSLQLFGDLSAQLYEPHMTMVTRVSFLKLFGQTWLKPRGLSALGYTDRQQGIDLLKRAHRLAVEANLTHQRLEIQRSLRNQGVRVEASEVNL